MAEKLKDPAEKGKEQREEKDLDEQMKGMDIGSLTMQDFRQLEAATARTPGPFEGYPLKPKIKIGETEVSETFIVALNPKHYVMQDPSGHRQTIVTDKRDGKGNKIGKGPDKIVNLRTFHSRIVKDYESGGDNIDIVFDREAKLKDGTLMLAIVPSHSARAQLLFELTREGKVKVDTRYVLLDFDQKSRLKRVFDILISPHLKIERAANIISGTSDEDPESIGDVLSGS